MLAFLAKKPFDDEKWLFEAKWDGFRTLASLQHDKVELYSRNFKSFNARFKIVVEELKKLDVEAVLDGEVVIFDKKGVSSFQKLQNYQETGQGDLRYCIFDFLYFEGRDMRHLPLLERKKLLEKLVAISQSPILQYCPHVISKGTKAFSDAQKNGLEGIIAKRIDSPYLSKRSRDWLKIKTHARQEVIICGFTKSRTARSELGALIAGVYSNGHLQYAGHVGARWQQASLLKKLKSLIVAKCPFENEPKTNMPVTWVKPKLIAEVSFHEWTSNNHMRQPIFQGLRDDKELREVKKEDTMTLKTKKEARQHNASPSESHFTHLDKVYWPKEGYTKGELIQYYDDVAEYILPYLIDRPQSLHRYPGGIEETGFFQKNIDKGFPEWVQTYPVTHKEETRNYMLIPDKHTLLFAVNLGCIDFNPFSSRIQNLKNPDFLIFDLDPEDIPFEAVIETAQMFHKTLDEFGIPSFCKTSGATGLHILVPTGAKYSYAQVKLFAELICTLIHNKLPGITSLVRKPSMRKGKVYLDFLQNNFGQTIASPYSVRPRPKASVSTPLEWKEVKKGLEPTDFTIKNMLKRLKKKGDLFAPVLGKGINLPQLLKTINEAS